MEELLAYGPNIDLHIQMEPSLSVQHLPRHRVHAMRKARIIHTTPVRDGHHELMGGVPLDVFVVIAAFCDAPTIGALRVGFGKAVSTHAGLCQAHQQRTRQQLHGLAVDMMAAVRQRELDRSWRYAGYYPVWGGDLRFAN